MNEAGAPIVGDTFMVLLNASPDATDFTLPAHRARVRWEVLLDTRDWDTRATRTFKAGDRYPLEARSLALLRVRTRAAP